MWIVKLALNRPYTFIVLALLVLTLSPVVILRTPTDIFPNIDILSFQWRGPIQASTPNNWKGG
jgi:multidrug efflux pump subunit AcrB